MFLGVISAWLSDTIPWLASRASLKLLRGCELIGWDERLAESCA